MRPKAWLRCRIGLYAGEKPAHRSMCSLVDPQCLPQFNSLVEVNWEYMDSDLMQRFWASHMDEHVHME